MSLFYVIYIVSCHLQSSNSEGFTSSFLIWIPLLFCCCCSLTAVAKISKTMLNSSGESGHPCLIADLRGNTFSFSLLRIIFALGLSYIYGLFPGCFSVDQSWPTVCNPVD